jgi:hypothetical protein
MRDGTSIQDREVTYLLLQTERDMNLIIANRSLEL